MLKEESENKISEEIQKLEIEMNSVSFWDDKEKAKEIINKIKELKEKRDGVNSLDKGNVLMTIIAGAGGDDSEDFAMMIFEMYKAYFSSKNFTYTILHSNVNEHGGYRNLIVEVNGRGVYGLLKNESGVHRLVRISPFNANSKRQTSFILVEVLPKLSGVEKVSLNKEDLKVETSKSSGPGGQNVNKRETAVRIVHVPTNISVSVSTERSQEHNKQKALEILESKLFKLEEEKKKAELEGRQISKTTEIEWGNQIRSYVLHPYKMIKDHRTDVEVSDVESVLKKGNLDKFIEAEKGL